MSDQFTDAGKMVHLRQALAEQDAADKRVEQWQIDVWQAYVDCYPDEIFNVGTGDYIAAMREMIAEITALKVELAGAQREILTLRDRAEYAHAPVELNDGARYLVGEGE